MSGTDNDFLVVQTRCPVTVEWDVPTAVTQTLQTVFNTTEQ